jgi:hypothetical protein
MLAGGQEGRRQPVTTTIACKHLPLTPLATLRVPLCTPPDAGAFRVEVWRHVSTPANEEALRLLACRQWVEQLLRRIREIRAWLERQSEGAPAEGPPMHGTPDGPAVT